MTHITYRLTAKNRDQLRNPTLDNRVAYGLPFYQLVSKRSVDGQHQDVDRTPRGRVDQNNRGKGKVRSCCGQPSDRGRLKNRTELITEARFSSGVVNYALYTSGFMHYCLQPATPLLELAYHMGGSPGRADNPGPGHPSRY